MDDKLTQFSNCQAAMTFVIRTRSEPFTGHNKENAIWKVLCLFDLEREEFFIYAGGRL